MSGKQFTLEQYIELLLELQATTWSEVSVGRNIPHLLGTTEDTIAAFHASTGDHTAKHSARGAVVAATAKLIAEARGIVFSRGGAIIPASAKALREAGFELDVCAFNKKKAFIAIRCDYFSIVVYQNKEFYPSVREVVSFNEQAAELRGLEKERKNGTPIQKVKAFLRALLS